MNTTRSTPVGTRPLGIDEMTAAIDKAAEHARRIRNRLNELMPSESDTVTSRQLGVINDFYDRLRQIDVELSCFNK